MSTVIKKNNNKIRLINIINNLLSIHKIKIILKRLSIIIRTSNKLQNSNRI